MSDRPLTGDRILEDLTATGHGATLSRQAPARYPLRTFGVELVEQGLQGVAELGETPLAERLTPIRLDP